MLILLIFVISAATSSVVSPEQTLSWDEFKQKYGLFFTNEEEKYRYGIYQLNITQLQTYPCEYCGVTKYFASTQRQIEQGRSLFLPQNYKQLVEQQQKESQTQSFISRTAHNIRLKLSASDSLDWREQGAVTPAKKQGTCGTCWSFATVAMCQSSLILQGRAMNTKIYQVDLSQQYLLKCTPGSSCSGGYLQNAIDKALKSGLPFENTFPYQPYSNNYGVCATRDLLMISNKTRVSRYQTDDSTIISMLQDGPVVAAVSATGWEKYATGVFRCSVSAQINHAVQIVGYTPSYWIIKNSWGTDFGQEGFIYVSRQSGASCGIGTAVHKLWDLHIQVEVVVLLALMGFLM